MRLAAFHLIARAISSSAVLLLPATFAAEAFAQVASADDSQRAVSLYAEGRDLLTAGKPAQALPKLVESLRLLPSPNTELLIAHAKRELGRRAEAFETYERVVVNAQAEIRRGQDRYKGTLDEAKRWVGALGGELGTVVVTAPEGANVEVQRGDTKSPAAFVGSGRAVVEPGEVRVTMTLGARVETKTASVERGKSTQVEFSTTAPAVPEQQQQQATQTAAEGPVVSIAGIVLLGAGVVGMGMFAGFGVSAQAEYDGLVECSPNCPESRREEQESGDRDKLIANVSLGIGAGLLAAGTTVWIVEAVMAGGENEPPAPAPAARLDVGVPGAVDAAGLTLHVRY